MLKPSVLIGWGSTREWLWRQSWRIPSSASSFWILCWRHNHKTTLSSTLRWRCTKGYQMDCNCRRWANGMYLLLLPPSFCLSRHPHHHISYITSSHSCHITHALLHSLQHIHSHLFAFTCTYTSHLPTSFSHLLQVISYLSGSRLRAWGELGEEVQGCSKAEDGHGLLGHLTLRQGSATHPSHLV